MREEKIGGAVAIAFSLPFALQKEVGCGAKPHKVRGYYCTEAGEAAASGVRKKDSVLTVIFWGRCVWFRRVAVGFVGAL